MRCVERHAAVDEGDSKAIAQIHVRHARLVADDLVPVFVVVDADLPDIGGANPDSLITFSSAAIGEAIG